MKVIGLGSPDDVRVRFAACEIDVLVDVLRDLRAKATRHAADTYATTSPRDTRPIDDRHDRLRGIEALLMQLEEQPPDNAPGAILVAATPLMRDVAHDAAREALERLHDAHERYEEHVTLFGDRFPGTTELCGEVFELREAVLHRQDGRRVVDVYPGGERNVGIVAA